MNKHRISWRSLALVAGLSLVIAAGETSTSIAADTPSRGGTLIYGIAADIQHFDPALLPAVNFPIMAQLYDSVVRLDEKTQPQPALAESWEFGSDGLSLTLHLRHDVVFHDGTPLTAKDIEWNIKRYQDAKTGANARVMFLSIKSTKVVDDYTLVLGFAAPQAAIFDGLDLLYITKPTDDLDSIRTTPIGTGPFKLENRAPGDSITLVRNDKYWNKGLPYLDKVEIRVMPDSLAGIVALQTGDIQLLGTPPEKELDGLAKTGGIDVLRATSPSVVSDVLFNVKSDGPFADKRVRQAVHYAVDRQRIDDVVYAGHSETWCLPWQSGSPAFTPAARDCPRDLDKARKLLADAGYPNGFKTSMMVQSDERNLLIGQIVASNLADIGITATIDQVNVPQDRWASGDFAISIHGYGRANRDPATLLTTTSIFRPANNFAKYQSDEYTKLVNDINTTIDPVARKKLFADLDKLMLDQMWLVSIAPNFLAYAHASDVKGLQVNLDGMPFLDKVWISK